MDWPSAPACKIRCSAAGRSGLPTCSRSPGRGRHVELKLTSLSGTPFRSSGMEPPNATVYADTINVRVRLAATGPYLAIVPASIMRFPGVHPGIKVLPVELPTTRRQIAIFRLKNRTPSPLAQLFIECAREIAGRLADSPVIGPHGFPIK